LSVTSGLGVGTGDGGAVNVTTGAGGVTSGNSGALNLKSGIGGATSGASGIVTLASGVAAVLLKNSGAVNVGSGTVTTGTSGIVTITSGAASGAGTSGAVNILTGTTAAGTRGDMGLTAQNITLTAIAAVILAGTSVSMPERTDGQVFLSAQMGHPVSGTYTLTEVAADLYAMRRTAAAGVDTFVIPIPIATWTTALEGVKISSIKVIYSVATADLDDVIIKINKGGVPADGSISTVANVAFTYDAAHDSAAERADDTGAPEYHTMTCTIDTPGYIDASEKWDLEIATDGDAGATGVLDIYGIQINYSYTY